MLRDRALVVMAAFIAAAVVCLALFIGESMADFDGFFDGGNVEPRHDSAWIALCGLALLACAVGALASAIVAIAAGRRPRVTSVRGPRMTVVGAALAAAFACLLAGSIADMHLWAATASACKLALMASVVVALAGAIGVIFVRPPPVVPPARITLG